MQIRNKPDPLWQVGTCDRIYLTLMHWALNYESGKKSATNKRMSMPGEVGPEVREIEVVTRRAYSMPWNYNDLEYLVRIMEAKVPTHLCTKDLRRNLPKWKNCPLCPAHIMVNQKGQRVAYSLVSPTRMVTIDFYEENVIQMIRLMEAIRDGKTKEARSNLAEVDLSSFS